MSSELVQLVEASDSIKISKVAFNYRVDPIVIDPGSILRYDFCPGKPKGKLLLDVDLDALGFGGIDFHATATGVPDGEGPSGEPLVRWNVDQAIGKHLPEFDLRLVHIVGHFVTAISKIDPAVKQTSCSGGDRFYGGILTNGGKRKRLPTESAKADRRAHPRWNSKC